MRKFQKPELLAPAGNMEKLRMALLYGADAVYLGGKLFGLRAFASNFSTEEMKEAGNRGVSSQFREECRKPKEEELIYRFSGLLCTVRE